MLNSLFSHLSIPGSGMEPAICQLHLKRHTGRYEAYLGFSSINYGYLQQTSKEYLHPQEQEQYLTFGHDRKRASFLHGRFLAKKVLSPYLLEKDLKTIRIKSGVFEQPLVCYPVADTPMVSISHTDTYAACLAFSDEHPMGIDLETITQEAKANISSQLTHFEQKFQNILQEEEDRFYTRIWTIKEALSKVLKTGLMTPFEIYQIHSIEIVSPKGISVSTFSHFEQYKAISFPLMNTICSIVLPRETSIDSLLPYGVNSL